MVFHIMEEMKTLRVVAAVIEKDDRILIAKRSYGEYADHWEFPGGKYEEGESGEEAIKREIREEFDTDIRVKHFLCTIEHQYDSFFLLMDCFICELLDEHLILHDHSGITWIKEDEEDIRWQPADRKVIEAYRLRKQSKGKTMWREIQRKKQILSEAECHEILKKELRGVLSLNGDDGYPYGLPINHYYNEDENCLYFHSGKTGYKVGCLKRNDKASFCLMDKGQLKDNDWALNIRSVIAFGKIEIVEDEDVIIDICRKLSHKFTDDERYIDDEINRSLKGTLMFRLRIEHMSGKIVNEK